MKPEEMVGKRIAEIRARSGMTQQQLGEQLGELLPRPWPRQTVSGAERGDRAFTAAELVAIAHVLHVVVGALLVPPLDAEAEQIEMPSGAKLDRAEIERIAVDPETRNVLPIAAEAIRKAAVRLNENIARDHLELRELADVYEALTITGKVPTDAADARLAEQERLARRAHGLPDDEATGRGEEP